MDGQLLKVTIKIPISLYIYIYIYQSLCLKQGRKLFGDFFFCLGIFFWISGSHHFPCYLQHFGAGNCHFTVCATVLSSNLSFSIVFSTVFATVCSMFCPFSMLFAAFLSWNLHFHRMCNILQLHSSQYLQDFGAEGWHSNSCLLLLLLLLVLVLVLLLLVCCCCCWWWWWWSCCCCCCCCC